MRDMRESPLVDESHSRSELLVAECCLSSSIKSEYSQQPSFRISVCVPQPMAQVLLTF